jgi:uncharacterized membrane protein
MMPFPPAKSVSKQLRWLQIGLAIAILLGVCFRLVNMGQKPYWHDEIFTLLRSSGRSEWDVLGQLFTGKVVSPSELMVYQHPMPGTTVWNTVTRLMEEDSQHPPLYYAMARLWAEWFGSSSAATRSLPVLISLLEMPLMYWLCLELFASAMVASLGTALVAVCPLFVRYAQEIREYSLWIVFTLLSSITLLRALRLQTPKSWVIYTLTAIASLYTHLLAVLVVLSHGLYVLILARFRLNKALRGFVVSAAIAGVSLLPWAWAIWTNREMVSLTTAWMKESLPLPILMRFWGIQLCQAFIAWHLSYNNWLIYLSLPILAMIVAALWHLVKHTPQRIWLFVLSLIGVTFLCIVLPDLIWADKRSANARYFLPCYIGIQLATAYYLTDQMGLLQNSALTRSRQYISKASQAGKQRIWQIMTILLISCGVITCAFSASAPTWWGWSEFDVEAPRVVNAAANPLVISDMRMGGIFPMAHRLDSQAKLLLLQETTNLNIPSGFSDVFVYNPSDRLRSLLQQQQLNLEVAYQFNDNGYVISLYRIANWEQGVEGRKTKAEGRRENQVPSSPRRSFT